MKFHSNSLYPYLFPFPSSLTVFSSSSTSRATAPAGYTSMPNIQVKIYVPHPISNHFVILSRLNSVFIDVADLSHLIWQR